MSKIQRVKFLDFSTVIANRWCSNNVCSVIHYQGESVALFEYSDFLVSFLIHSEYFLFEWDSGNVDKNEKKHGVKKSQIEEGFYGPNILPLGVQISPTISGENRYAIIGQDKKGIVIFICFTFRNGKIRPISARRANKKERLIYEK